MGNLVVQSLHGGLQGFQLLLQAGTLLYQDILAGCFGAFLEKQRNILDKGFRLHSGTTHTLDEFHPAAGCLVKFTDAVCFAGDVGDKAPEKYRLWLSGGGNQAIM